MAAKQHSSNIVTGLHHKLAESNLLPDFLTGKHGAEFFAVIFFSWVVIIGLTLVSFLVSRRLKKIPNRLQGVLEVSVEMLANLLDSLIGPGGRKYLPLLGTIFIYIFCMNLLGLIPGLMSPTANLNSTFALSIPTILLIQYFAMKELGLSGYFKHLGGSPQAFIMWLLFPLMFVVHLIGELVKPLSLGLRLRGNIYGEEQIIHALVNLARDFKIFGLPLLPLPMPMMAFAIFTSFLQAFIFTALSCIYIMTLISHEE